MFLSLKEKKTKPGMQFCDKCNNMLYMQIAPKKDPPDESLYYYCRCCGFQTKVTNQMNLCVSSYEESSEKTPMTKINEFTVFDKTLKHNYTLRCPFTDCPTQTQHLPNDVIEIRTDDQAMKYTYLCTHCKSSWSH
jgi:DNA-directed RNA polymerase subunit M/transcription elongation factor TFIIS